jgi:hypothetical protein
MVSEHRSTKSLINFPVQNVHGVYVRPRSTDYLYHCYPRWDPRSVIAVKLICLPFNESLIEDFICKPFETKSVQSHCSVLSTPSKLSYHKIVFRSKILTSELTTPPTAASFISCMTKNKLWQVIFHHHILGISFSARSKRHIWPISFYKHSQCWQLGHNLIGHNLIVVM